MQIKAVALLSGGLDSSLAIRLMLDQAIEVEALHFVSVFNGTAPETPSVLRPLRVARQLGVALRPIRFTAQQLAIVRDPPHGYGSQMNPCIDCHVAMLRRAAERMRESGARFIVTGEVLGQRPMSQRGYALRRIDEATGLGGLILRPLSARLLPPTQPEEKGWVDRERLLDIQGRSRKRQLELARRYGITEHGSPAGGCLLTDPGFSARLADLFAEIGEAAPDLSDVHLLKLGRHFRLGPRTRAIVGRVHRENATIHTFSRPGDLLLTTRDAPGPTTLLRCGADAPGCVARGLAAEGGCATCPHLQTAAALTARYSKLRGQRAVAIEVAPGRKGPQEARRVVEAAPITDEAAAMLRIESGPKFR